MITRFAPSPTGLLHLGHAYSAILGHDMARAAGGTFLLRIEDLDGARCRPEFEGALRQDLHWLGLDWPEPVLRQSDRLPVYDAAIGELAAMGLVYPCRCTRSDIRAALSAPQEGVPMAGSDGLVYPGTCRGRQLQDQRPGDALRLDMAGALRHLSGRALRYVKTGPLAHGAHEAAPAELIDGVGDVVLGRRDYGGASYHLASVVDDAAQGVTLVLRGQDLAQATAIHVLLQALLGLPTPAYHHHRLIRDETGKRLAKRDDARAIESYRAKGVSPAGIRGMIGL